MQVVKLCISLSRIPPPWLTRLRQFCTAESGKWKMENGKWKMGLGRDLRIEDEDSINIGNLQVLVLPHIYSNYFSHQ